MERVEQQSFSALRESNRIVTELQQGAPEGSHAVQLRNAISGYIDDPKRMTEVVDWVSNVLHAVRDEEDSSPPPPQAAVSLVESITSSDQPETGDENILLLWGKYNEHKNTLERVERFEQLKALATQAGVALDRSKQAWGAIPPQDPEQLVDKKELFAIVRAIQQALEVEGKIVKDARRAGRHIVQTRELQDFPGGLDNLIKLEEHTNQQLAEKRPVRLMNVDQLEAASEELGSFHPNDVAATLLDDQVINDDDRQMLERQRAAMYLATESIAAIGGFGSPNDESFKQWLEVEESPQGRITEIMGTLKRVGGGNIVRDIADDFLHISPAVPSVRKLDESGRLEGLRSVLDKAALVYVYGERKKSNE